MAVDKGLDKEDCDHQLIHSHRPKNPSDAWCVPRSNLSLSVPDLSLYHSSASSSTNIMTSDNGDVADAASEPPTPKDGDKKEGEEAEEVTDLSNRCVLAKSVL